MEWITSAEGGGSSVLERSSLTYERWDTDQGEIVMRYLSMAAVMAALLWSSVACTLDFQFEQMPENRLCLTSADGPVCVEDVQALPWVGDWREASVEARLWHACAIGFAEGFETFNQQNSPIEMMQEWGYSECFWEVDAVAALGLDEALEEVDQFCRTGYELGLTMGNETEPTVEDLEWGAAFCRAHLETSLI